MQLRAKCSDLQKQADDVQKQQLKQLVAANARLHASKGNGKVDKAKRCVLRDTRIASRGEREKSSLIAAPPTKKG